ncbi:MAG: nucleotide-binding protein [Gammaproteobacteria bacterium]|nr:nucleotide-binding protein [Gammaproteobacteria bacterium]
MLARFSGDAGRRNLLQALAAQKIVAGNADLAQVLAELVELREVPLGAAIIEQGGMDDDVYLVLAGAFDVVVNGRKVARRFPNDHVGEMAAIQPNQVRAATVVATENAVVGKLKSQDMADLGDRYPEIYRRIAQELAARLQQRNAHVGAARTRTKVFVISSRESLGVARAVQNALAHDGYVVVPWTDGVFRVGAYTMQSLLDAVDDSDFAVAIAHADDVTAFRGQDWPTPRDNVVFELGLFMGRLGKERAVLMEPRDSDVKLPSDLAGVTTITYRYEPGQDMEALMGPACNMLRQHFERLGPNI